MRRMRARARAHALPRAFGLLAQWHDPASPQAREARDELEGSADRLTEDKLSFSLSFVRRPLKPLTSPSDVMPPQIPVHSSNPYRPPGPAP
jgi:hypothetical protein